MRRLAGGALCAMALLAGEPATAAPDPLEEANRRVHAFNQVVRHQVLTPAAEAYRAVTTPAIRRGLGQAVANLGEPVAAASGLLAGRTDIALNAAARFGINSTLGLGGVRDSAAGMGFPRQGFGPGDTLCAWGVGSGPYLVLPLVGPTTLRDAAARLATGFALSALLGSEVVAGWSGAEAFLGYEAIQRDLDAAEAGALDPYALLRAAHLGRRAGACATDRAAMEEQE